ncbi:hypothetical protein FOZ60_011940 [Perkinsus olseni]|uniref:Uncharacterized protein n=1 Tax=Perkinsus olseni TaxID=32597 RepID=A0A7J6NCH7_PEROL|nr:hypothetical protein FOZ60_011940 [Perkinsus olseni]
MPSPIRHSILIAIGLVQTATGRRPPMPSTGVYVEIKNVGEGVAADLAFHRVEGTRSIIPELVLRKSRTNTLTPFGMYITRSCYTLGNDQDIPKFRKCTLHDILFFTPRATQICVDRDSSDRKGKYSRAKLLLGRLLVDGSYTAQFNISLVLDENRPAAVGAAAGRTIFEEPLNTHNEMRMHSDHGGHGMASRFTSRQAGYYRRAEASRLSTKTGLWTSL